MTPEPTPAPTPRPTRAVAIDLGERRIGVAVSDSAGAMAFPRPRIDRSGDREADHRAIVAVVDEVGAGVVVVGLPLSLDGRHGQAAAKAAGEAQEIAAALRQRGVTVETLDERLTTVSAHAAMATAGKRSAERRGGVDSAAATVLLQSWLDRQ
jgi:putative holliday junction resolvase